MKKVSEKLLNHPRPQQYRESWRSLNGEWDFAFDFDNIGKTKKWWKNTDVFDHKINVPFVYQSELSGIGEDKECNVVWYKLNFDIDSKEDKSYLLHFQAVDYKTEVWLNEQYIGSNENGFFDFNFNITGLTEEKDNNLVIRVEDFTKTYQNLGKQTYKDEPFLCWYTRSTGIWQDVWIEEVGYNYIDDIMLTPDLQTSKVHIDVNIAHKGKYDLKTEIFYKDLKIAEGTHNVEDTNVKSSFYLSTRHADFRLYYWSPAEPNLYDIKFTLLKDGEVIDYVESYFGMRKVDSNSGYVTINNEKLFHKMVLDQGYFGKGLMTPPTVEWLHQDVVKCKEMGFNGVRKHQKIEDNRFMYLCDVYGLIMWAELPSFYEYSFKSSAELAKTLSRFVKKHYNSPAVCAYVIFNESWGLNRIFDSTKIQNLVNGSFYLVKSMDSTRLVIGNDGWEHTLTDIVSIHDYNGDAEQIIKIYEDEENAINNSPSKTSNKYNFVPGYGYDNQPFFISEYGGVAFETDTAKEFNTWGYGERITDLKEVLSKISDLTNAFADNEYITGICYTQLSDVEQEINGLLDHNHEYKFDVEDIKKALTTRREGGFVFE